MTVLDEDRRRELARDAFDVPMMPTGITGDPYWLCNLHGEVSTDGLRDYARRMEHDAELLRMMASRIESKALLPEEAALSIAQDAELGEYTVHEEYSTLPITEEADSA
jgi:hypothetical protein